MSILLETVKKMITKNFNGLIVLQPVKVSNLKRSKILGMHRAHVLSSIWFMVK